MRLSIKAKVRSITGARIVPDCEMFFRQFSANLADAFAGDAESVADFGKGMGLPVFPPVIAHEDFPVSRGRQDGKNLD